MAEAHLVAELSAVEPCLASGTQWGFSHQDPGFIDVALNKKADIVRVYLPPDANTLLCVTDHVLRTWNRINIIVEGKPPSWQWLPCSNVD